jgi:enamine deaminase RidA (YjgF/YER057c/UK114 family)
VIEYLNPSTLYTPERYSQVAVSTGSKQAQTAGQIALDENGTLIGAGDYRAQTVRATKNVFLALDAAGARPSDVTAMMVYLVDPTGANLEQFREGFREVREAVDAGRCALTVVGVPELAMPGAVVEISASATFD